MPAFQPGNYNLLDCSNGQNAAFSTNTPLRMASSAPVKLVGEDCVQRNALPPSNQNTFSYYENLMVSSTFPVAVTNKYGEYDDDYTDCLAIGSAEVAGSMFPDRPGGGPCNLTARLANRSNGAPLATIVEQCSRSTLNSRVSLLSLGCATPLQSPEHASSRGGSHKDLNYTKDVKLSRLPEVIPPVQAPRTIAGSKIAGEGGSVLPVITNVPRRRVSGILPGNTTESQSGHAKYTTGGQRLSAFFHHVVHHVQRIRAKPWSSTLIETTAVNIKGGRAEPNEDGPRSHKRKSDTAQTTRNGLSAPSSRNGSTPDPKLTPFEEPRIRNRQTPSTTSLQPSARADPPLLTALSHESESTTDTSFVPRLLPPSVVTRSRERFASVHPVQPKPRDGARNGGTAETPTLPTETRSDTPVLYQLERVSAYLGNASSLAQCSHAKESSRNASFCSTMSTSYSGTVLGVDLDLGPEPAGVQNLRRSRSPTPVAAPAWFTPQMAELERQASGSESPERILHDRPNTTSHSMRSFALTSLLPIAAASGVVTPNYNTPKISFYSPSGNLIQPESSSPPETSSSEFSGSPTGLTSYYRNTRSPPTRKTLQAATYLPPVRPALVPMTTPPTFSAALPAHLRHHHNYRHPEKSQIQSTESFILPTPAVRGCDGMVKSPSFTPRSGIRNQHENTGSGQYRKHNRSTRSIIDDLRFEASFYKAGLITKATTSCGPIRKGKVLQKRNVIDKRTEGGTASYKKNNRGSAARTVVVEEKARLPSTSLGHDHSTLGPLAGHAMRVCFCQPYDGAGRSNHAVAADRSCIAMSKSASIAERHAKQGQEVVQEADSALPNARVIGKKTDPTYQTNKGVTSGRAGTRARTRSDSVVSVGVGHRVAAVGA
ncbi:hypothetical protein T440DRAFT_319410 [Plenodomus tracheiphilus IPT5]|uniref:Uncharacterized protein n=1 Tax=Plenodomus tracheiphilus IPT5 TaxID=1408161 RepID=A0A6A7BCJ7_9PLEO|nr:hypothetical protein T440DRAFT_319410 [Plenodomus tracheiphilus IPT5]